MLDQSLFDGVKNSVRLKIKTSNHTLGGLGLTAAAAIPAGEDIFSKESLLHIADSVHFSTTCDHCFIWVGDTVNLKTSTISTGIGELALKKCSGYEVVRYCSGVSYYRHPPLQWRLSCILRLSTNLRSIWQ